MHPALSEARFNQDLAFITEEICDQRGWTIFGREYPVLDIGFTSPKGNRLRARFTCDNWNEQAPSVTLHTWDGSMLSEMPPSSTAIFNAGPHPLTRHPFICMRGVREWHTHSSHISDVWEPFRNQPEYTLGGIISQVWGGWVRAN